MGVTIKANRIDENLWIRHRPTIERLYVKEQKRLEGEDGVIAYIKKNFKFTARYVRCLRLDQDMLTSRSKSQYEKNFKKWGLRKNLTSLEWRRTIRYIKQNSLLGEQVQVLFRNIAMSPERVFREIARYGPTCNHTDIDKGTCHLPRDVVVQSRSSASNSDIPRVLRTVPPQATNSQLQLTLPTVARTKDNSTVVSTFIAPKTSSPSEDISLQLGQYNISSWKSNIDWSLISQIKPSSHQSTLRDLPLTKNFKAMSYTTAQADLMSSQNGYESAVLPIHLTTLLLNNITHSEGYTLEDAYQWLTALSPSEASQIMKSLHTSIHDAFRERVFIAAVEAADARLRNKQSRLVRLIELIG